MIKPIYRSNKNHTVFTRIIDKNILRVQLIEFPNGNKSNQIDELVNMPDEYIQNIINTTIECSDDTFKLMKRTLMFNLDEII